ncbi:MAG TPA: hypothetical protein VK388_12375 [Pyrinomonadaceae bacterium]|nr:hypothetical protein [Pyrinomonadaceae bacterium]
MLESRKRLTSRALAAALGCVALLTIEAPDASRTALAAPEVVSIAEARALPTGALVTVEGSVTVPSGAFKSGTSDEGFAIQDASGGLYVRTDANLGLRVRRRVRVTGRLADSNGQLILVTTGARDVKPRACGANIRAETIPTGRVGEATEGRLVHVSGTITKPVGNDLPYGYRVFINDGSGEVQTFVYASTSIDVSGLQPGRRLGVTGFSGQYKDHYEIIPRFQSDVRAGGR